MLRKEELFDLLGSEVNQIQIFWRYKFVERTVDKGRGWDSR